MVKRIGCTLLMLGLLGLSAALAAPLHPPSRTTTRFIIPTNRRVVLYVADG